MSVRLFAISGFLLAALSSAFADIDYKVVIQPTSAEPAQQMQVTVTIPVRGATTSLQMPNWGPGSYVLPNPAPWQALADIKVMGDGKELATTKPNDYTWTVPTAGVKKLVFSYSLPTTITEEIGHYRGPNTYAYVIDRKDEKCNLTISVPTGWNIATGLDRTQSAKDFAYSAPTYYTLADNPVTFGKYRQLEYVVDGRPHILAMYGPARNNVDTDKLLKACSFISAMENDFFGNKPPYTHYVWHFNINQRPDGGGGLEHLASTEITLANGLGNGIIGVNAHEFFHLWNVKRIRSRVLGPFDYTKLPETGALWWLEGITEYYAHQLMTRYGYWDDKKFYATLVTNTTRVRSNPARLQVGPYEASFRVKDAANGRGNSNGYQISYYDLGVLAGICLDTEIIARTNGQHSLDDVEHALWDECKNDQPGFPEDDIRNLLVKFGGISLGDMYDRIIMRGGEMPLEEQLAKVGVTMSAIDKLTLDPGFVATTSFRSGAGGQTVNKVTGPGEGKLKVDDVIVSVNGTPVPTGGALNAALANVKPGDTLNLKVKRGESDVELQIAAGSVNKPSWKIEENPNATPEQVRLRNIWLFRGKKGWQPPALAIPPSGK